jgi:thiopeptide-type bacteriocin biosynthesis protein
MARRNSRNSAELTESGFAVLRTPLLPIETLSAWSSNLRATNVLAGGLIGDNDQLESAIEHDRQQLIARLREMLADDVVSQAVYIASSGMAKTMTTWLERPDYERGCKAVPTLASYVLRMATRPTPFGLLAGCSMVFTGPTTDLRLCPRAQYRTHTRLDVGYLSTLCDRLGREASIRDALIYRRNPGLYMTAGHWRLAERRAELNGRGHTYHLVSIEPSVPLAATLERASKGARLAELAEALCQDHADVLPDQAKAYIDELVNSQILLPVLEPPITGPDALKDIIAILRQTPVQTAFLEPLEHVAKELDRIDATNLGMPAARYESITARLAELPVPATSRHLFHVDLYKTAIQGTVGPAVIKTVREGIFLLRRLFPPTPRQDLQTFVKDFVDRFQDREVPLMQALDEEAGIGFGKAPPEQSHASPLLAGLELSRSAETLMPWGEREAILFRKLGDALQSGETVIRLDKTDYQDLQAKHLPELPDALSVNVTLLADSSADIDHGNFKLLWHGAFGPSGALYLGRFCHGDASLYDSVKRHLAREEAQRPDAIFAEIVHRPQDRLGNVICRPNLRSYEIPYHGRSGIEANRQIAIGDLFVRVVNGRLVLRSKRLDCEIIPRLTTAHNAPRAELGAYRFLCALSTQGVAHWLSWDWGALESATFLPRVEAGRLVLARARWRLDANQLARIAGVSGGKLLRRICELRDRLGLPRWVLVTQADRLLPLDLDNIICAEILASTARGQAALDLTEMYPEPEDCCVTGPEGSYTHELVIPFEQRKRLQFSSIPRSNTPTEGTVRRLFPPGDAWLYVKVYTGPAGANQILQSAISPLITSALNDGRIDSWFFLRYADPETHLRIRMHGNPGALGERVWPALEKRLQPFLDNGTVWRVTLDTYDREIERYGGDAGIALAEAVFHADSDATIKLLRLSEQDDGIRNWQLALLSVHRLLADLGIDLEDRCRQLGAMCSGLKTEFVSENPIDRELSRKYRDLRNEVESVLQAASDSHDDFLVTAISILDRRSAQLAPIRERLVLAAETGSLTRSPGELAQSFVHMAANRLFRTAARAQELVLYEFLLRYYRSMTARSRMEESGRR